MFQNITLLIQLVKQLSHFPPSQLMQKSSGETHLSCVCVSLCVCIVLQLVRRVNLFIFVNLLLLSGVCVYIPFQDHADPTSVRAMRLANRLSFSQQISYLSI